MWKKIFRAIRKRLKSLDRFLVSIIIHKPKLKALLSKSENHDFNAIDSNGWHPLHRAIDIADTEILKKLLQKGANPNFYKHDYVSPVNFAIFNEDLEIVTFLIEHGANVNMLDGLNWTPITKAIDQGNLEMITTLLQNGADVNMR